MYSSDPIVIEESSDQELQKALALSIQDMQQSSATGAGGGISIEDQELSRLSDVIVDSTSVVVVVDVCSVSVADVHFIICYTHT